MTYVLLNHKLANVWDSPLYLSNYKSRWMARFSSSQENLPRKRQINSPHKCLVLISKATSGSWNLFSFMRTAISRMSIMLRVCYIIMIDHHFAINFTSCTHIPVGVTPDVGYYDAVLFSPLVSINSVHLHIVLCWWNRGTAWITTVCSCFAHISNDVEHYGSARQSHI